MSKKLEAMIAEASHPGTNRKRLWKLFDQGNAQVRRSLLNNPNLCPIDEDDRLDTSLLITLAKEFPEEVAANPIFVLHALIEPNHDMDEVVFYVAKLIKDVAILDLLFRTHGTSCSPVRRAMARNTATPVEILRVLGNETTEPDDEIRILVAVNTNSTEDILLILKDIKTESSSTVRSVAENTYRARSHVASGTMEEMVQIRGLD